MVTISVADSSDKGTQPPSFRDASSHAAESLVGYLLATKLSGLLGNRRCF